MSDTLQSGNETMEGRISPWEERKKPAWENTLSQDSHLASSLVRVSPTQAKAAWFTRQGASGRHRRPNFCSYSCHHQAYDVSKLQH